MKHPEILAGMSTEQKPSCL